MSMNFLNVNLFAFVHHHPLKSQFGGVGYLADSIGFKFNQDQLQEIQPERLFVQLVHSPIDELDLLQVFALMGWNHHQWKSHDGRIAMKNWWLSALHQEKAGDSRLRLVMVLRSILADTERYPAPKDVVQVMCEVLQQLIDSGEWGQDQKSHAVLVALLADDAEVQLAQLAIQQHQTVFKMVQAAKFPTKLPIIQDANIEWLRFWLELNRGQRQALHQSLDALLHRELELEQKLQFASLILNHAAFSISIEFLERKVKDYPELVVWLSACARQSAFKSRLSLDERRYLNCWIGTGNYESLHGILMQVAQQTEDIGNQEKTENRYIFWKNYQHFFQEAWLLLPTQYLTQHQSHLANVKQIQGTDYPVVVLKIGDYFVFQYFLGTAAKNDLLMTDDIVTVEKILNQNIVSDMQIQHLNLVLIHDHLFKWQSDLAYILHQHFNIQAKDQKVYFTQRFHTHYLLEVEKSDFIHERKQWKNLPQWVKHNLKQKYAVSVYRKAALTAIRHHLLD